jgi:2-polyprenyl-6-methoxyphenol hydroxylase-like FAD-dependent oxidoreductase
MIHTTPTPLPVSTEVLIVGAGPTGLSLAVQLMRYGIDFVILDQKSDVTALSKALVVHARSLEIYDQVGLAQPAVAAGEQVQKVVLMHDGQVRAHLDFSDFGAELSPFPFVLVYEQSKNERLLSEYLQRHGHPIAWQTELETLTQAGDRVLATVKTATGEQHTLSAHYLVGCDGANSTTRQLLGLPFVGSTHPRLFYVADVEMDFPGEPGTLYPVLGQDSFVLMVPMQGKNRWRLVGNLPEYEDSDEDEAKSDLDFEAIAPRLQQLVQQPLNLATVNWFSTYRVHTRRAETFSLGRCFLAGDAAHIHTPAGGQGMNTGIQDAYNLAWKLAFMLRDQAAPALLDTYSEERVANAKRLLQTTDQAFEVVASDRWYFRLFRETLFPTLAGFVTQFSAAKEFLFPVLSQIGLDYRDSSLSLHGQDAPFAVQAGDRLPYFRVEGENVYDWLHSPCFHWIVFTDGQQDYSELQQQLELTYPDAIQFHIIPLYPRVVELFGSDRPFYLLLRPDHHIAFLMADQTLDLLLTQLKLYFQSTIGHP